MEKKVYLKQGIAFAGFPTAFKRSSPGSKVFLFFLVLAITAAAGWYAVQFNSEKKPVEKTPQISQTQPTMTTSPVTPTPNEKTTVTPTKKDEKLSPTVTPKVTPKAQSLTIEVLNGSGVAGVAKTMSDHLEAKGYTVSTSGNAGTFDYTGVTIIIKKSKKAELQKLKASITSGDYIVSETAEDLDEASDVDAQVIVGK